MWECDLSCFSERKRQSIIHKKRQGTACEREPDSHYCPLVACATHTWPDSSTRIPDIRWAPPCCHLKLPSPASPSHQEEKLVDTHPLPPSRVLWISFSTSGKQRVKAVSQTRGDLLSGSCLTTFHLPMNSLQNLPPTAQRSVLGSPLSLQQHQVFTGQVGTQDWSSHLPEESLPIPMYQSPKGTVCSSCHLTQVLLEIKILLLSQQGMQLCRTTPAWGHGYLSNPSFLGIQDNPAFLPVITDPLELESTKFPAAFFFSHPERHLPSQQQDFISLTFIIE